MPNLFKRVSFLKIQQNKLFTRLLVKLKFNKKLNILKIVNQIQHQFLTKPNLIILNKTQ